VLPGDFIERIKLIQKKKTKSTCAAVIKQSDLFSCGIALFELTLEEG
jgi:hypothetical protein